MDPHLGGYDPTRHQGHGLRRLASVYLTARNVGVGVGVLALGFVAEYAFKDELKPSTVAGQIFGRVYSGEQNAARPASVETARQLALVQQQEQSKREQQLIAQQYAQQYAQMTTMPMVLGSYGAQGFCLWGMATNDPTYLRGCAVAQTLNNGINQQAGAAMDNLGPTRAWGGAPVQGGGPTPAVADAAPLSQPEFDRIHRLQVTLKPSVVSECKAASPGITNNDRRSYLACLRIAANEDQPAPSLRVIYEAGPRTPGPLPQSVKAN